ncbi:MAG: co-chaperone GroES [Campylobacterota bacterium]|nr:co-chaperone GroES [Campylobacterota bacterium]
MNFKPLGDRVLLKEEEPVTQTQSGIYIPDNASKEKPTHATIVAIGPDVKHVEVGDKVVYGKYAKSAAVTVDNEDYLVMEVVEILGVMK